MTVRKGEKLLLEPIICGVPWKIIESTDSIEDELTCAQGVTRPDKQCCYVNSVETPPEGLEFVCVHELGHAVMFTSGGKEALRQITRFGDSRCEQLEEFIVGGFLHAFWDTLKRNGWLKIPIGE